MPLAFDDQISCVRAASIVDEAKRIADFLIKTEETRSGLSVSEAIRQASLLHGVDAGTLHSLRYRWRDLQDVSGSVLEQLREAFENIYEHQRVRGAIEKQIEHLVKPRAMEAAE